MGVALASSALRQYQQAGTAAAAADASSHQLVQLLLGGALDRLASARGLAQQKMPAEKARLVGKAMAIIEHLRLTLDHGAGGTIAASLGALYDYMLQRLVSANANDDVGGFDEVLSLLRTLKSAWDELPPGKH